MTIEIVIVTQVHQRNEFMNLMQVLSQLQIHKIGENGLQSFSSDMKKN